MIRRGIDPKAARIFACASSDGNPGEAKLVMKPVFSRRPSNIVGIASISLVLLISGAAQSFAERGGYVRPDKRVRFAITPVRRVLKN
jgi:hypothetical protein